MSKMSDVDIEIQEMLQAGIDPVAIAVALDVPMEWVEATVASMEPEPSDESFDVFDDLDVHALARLEWCWSPEEDAAE
jgi:hypothetical protein